MADLPILFSAPMVRAILREIEQPGTGKTQTRRFLDIGCDEPPAIAYDGRIIAYDDGEREYRWPRTKAVGDRLYLREAWRVEDMLDIAAPSELDEGVPIQFEADGIRTYDDGWRAGKFRQGMFMPRWASRITLIVTDIRVERLQEISEADAVAEGVPPFNDEAGLYHSAKNAFWLLWDSLNAARAPWESNPWVVAYTFLPVLGNMDQVRP